jgi:hypothetical protein
MAEVNNTMDSNFKLKSMLVPETQEYERLSRLVTPKFEQSQQEQFGQEFSKENIQEMGARLRKITDPGVQKAKARLTNLLSGSGVAGGTPLALGIGEIEGQREAEIARQQSDLIQQSAREEALDRRSAESRLFELSRDAINKEYETNLMDIKREYQVEDRDFNVAMRKLETQFDLARSGQLKGSEAERVLKLAGVENIEDFFSDDEIALEREALTQGITVEELLDNRRMLGNVLMEDMFTYPERYAGLALDPEVELERQLRLARASKPDSPGKKSHFCIEFHKNKLISTRQLWKMTNLIIRTKFTNGDMAYWYIKNADLIAKEANKQGFDWASEVKVVKDTLKHAKQHDYKKAVFCYAEFCKRMYVDFGQNNEKIEPFNHQFYRFRPLHRIVGTFKILTIPKVWALAPKVLMQRVVYLGKRLLKKIDNFPLWEQGEVKCR